MTSTLLYHNYFYVFLLFPYPFALFRVFLGFFFPKPTFNVYSVIMTLHYVNKRNVKCYFLTTVSCNKINMR